MPENDTHGFVVAIAFDTARCETVAQTVKFQFGNVEVLHHFFVIVAIGAWLGWFCIVCEHEEVGVHYLFEWFEHFQQIFGHRNVANGVFCFGCIKQEFGVTTAIFDNINALNGFANGNNSVFGINIAPRESANFANAYAGAEANVNAEIAEREMFLYIVHYSFLIGTAQYFNALSLSFCRKLNIKRCVVENFVFCAEF